MVGFSTDPRFVLHDTGPHHPERADRIRAIARAVRVAGMVDSSDPFPEFEIDVGSMPPSPVKLLELHPQPAQQKWIETIHSRTYIEHIERVCAAGGGVLDTGDTPVSRESFEIAKLSLGSLLGCCDAVMEGQVQRAFSAARPPGHHAEPDRPMGFCLFANVAIAAKYLQQKHGLGNIAIVDFDVHHGNGTQACFEDDPTVLFISLHQHPRTLYPGSGYDYEVGEGAGRGSTLNIPFQPGAEDEDYLRAMRALVQPKLADFRPEILLVSAGFDAHQDDPLAQINLSEDGFGKITELLVQSANQLCGGKIISALEGGYNLRALGRSVVRHLEALA